MDCGFGRVVGPLCFGADTGLAVVSSVDGIDFRFTVAGGYDDESAFGGVFEEALYQLGPVIVLGKMGQQQVTHESGAVTNEELEGLVIGEVSFAAADAVL